MASKVVFHRGLLVGNGGLAKSKLKHTNTTKLAVVGETNSQRRLANYPRIHSSSEAKIKRDNQGRQLQTRRQDYNSVLVYNNELLLQSNTFAQSTPQRCFHTSPFQQESIRLNTVQRSVLSVGAAVAALTNPHRHDMVATLAETTGHRALCRVHRSMLDHPEGRLILRERPTINSDTVDLDALGRLPDGTLGKVYWQFLDDNKVTPDSRSEVLFVEDPELRYVMQRYREVHDLSHALLGMSTNMLGEVAVKWVESLQTGLPMCTGAAIFGPIRFKPKQRKSYLKYYLPWALKVGTEARPLLNVYYERRWDQDVVQLRQELGIEPFTMEG